MSAENNPSKNYEELAKEFLKPTFSPTTKIDPTPVAVITTSDIARINRRIDLSLKQINKGQAASMEALYGPGIYY
jgi:hypothetical protein